MLDPKLFSQGEVISYFDMCKEEGGQRLQRGMNYRSINKYSILLSSTRTDSPYEDEVVDDGRNLIYEGHDVPRSKRTPNPKEVDQPMHTKTGKFTQNGLFFEAAHKYISGTTSAEIVRVYEKIDYGIWVFEGNFFLVDAWFTESGKRKVFKFKLSLIDKGEKISKPESKQSLGRIIPSVVKKEVWDRDKGRCTECGSEEDLHFDHIIPYSKGGSSRTLDNIQLLCASHNLKKGSKII